MCDLPKATHCTESHRQGSGEIGMADRVGTGDEEQQLFQRYGVTSSGIFRRNLRNVGRKSPYY